jgi:hypothetical protein
VIDRYKLRNRLERLERRQAAARAPGVPPQFWEALSGMMSPDQVPSETRRLIESLSCQPAGSGANAIEEKIAAAATRALSTTIATARPTSVPTPSATGEGSP